MTYYYLMTLGNKRYYKFDEEIVLNIDGEVIEEPTTYVAVSDATTHTERLVFPIYIKPGFTEEDLLNHVKGCIEFDFTNIAGEITMMIYGGDETTIFPDDKYLNDLIEVNKGGGVNGN